MNVIEPTVVVVVVITVHKTQGSKEKQNHKCHALYVLVFSAEDGEEDRQREPNVNHENPLTDHCQIDDGTSNAFGYQRLPCILEKAFILFEQ